MMTLILSVLLIHIYVTAISTIMINRDDEEDYNYNCNIFEIDSKLCPFYRQNYCKYNPLFNIDKCIHARNCCLYSRLSDENEHDKNLIVVTKCLKEEQRCSNTNCVCDRTVNDKLFCRKNIKINKNQCTVYTPCKLDNECNDGFGCFSIMQCRTNPICIHNCNNINSDSFSSSSNSLHSLYDSLSSSSELTEHVPTIFPIFTGQPTTENPTFSPTAQPTIHPVFTGQPTTDKPTTFPTTDPTIAPTQEPTTDPTNFPTPEPTMKPSKAPTFNISEDNDLSDLMYKYKYKQYDGNENPKRWKEWVQSEWPQNDNGSNITNMIQRTTTTKIIKWRKLSTLLLTTPWIRILVLIIANIGLIIICCMLVILWFERKNELENNDYEDQLPNEIREVLCETF